MNKWTLACLVATVLANPLHAMHLAPDESGQVLLFPYYTVNGDHDTYFTIANTSLNGSLVKVRFLDARRGRPVLDLNVFLAPYDSWTAVIAQTSADAPPVLRTSDATCTVPAVPAEGLRFTTAGFDGTGELPADDLPHDVARTREGSIEVIAGGSIGAIRNCASWPGNVIPGMYAPFRNKINDDPVAEPFFINDRIDKLIEKAIQVGTDIDMLPDGTAAKPCTRSTDRNTS